MRRRRGEAGQVSVEAALVLPVFVVGILGALQLASLQRARLLTEYAAFNAARAGTVWSGNAERMTQAATISLLPAHGRTDGWANLARTRASFAAADALFRAAPLPPSRVPEALSRADMSGRVRVETLLPADEGAANWEELDFDAAPSEGAPDGSTLTVRVRYFHELMVPLANAAVFEAWRWTGLRGSGAGATRAEWAALTGLTLAGRYYVPLTATYSMRMQSNFHRKWLMREEGGR